MRYRYHDKWIDLKDRVCIQTGCLSGRINPQINLYIRASNICNASCRFCEYHGKWVEFDIDKYSYILKDLQYHGIVGKIQVTGGEPTLNPNIYSIINQARQLFPKHFIGMNTNGTNLDTMDSLSSLLDNIAISRHHYLDQVNNDIFRTKTASSNDLKALIERVGQDKIHLSCNIQKGYIGSVEEVCNYLEYAGDIGCIDVGFVSLMPVNEYAKAEAIDFIDILDKGIAMGEYLKYREFTQQHRSCRCANYTYLCSRSKQTIDFYARQVLNPDIRIGILVFDGEYLRAGFNGDIIL